MRTLVVAIALIAVLLAGVVVAFYLAPRAPSGAPAQQDPSGVPDREGPAPSVVLVVLDAFRADRLGATRNGEPITPNLDAFAKTAHVFDRAVTPCTWTKPAMASLFTSLYVDAHQVYFSYDPQAEGPPTADVLPDAFETMAEYMQTLGYATAGIQTNANLTAELGFAQGFDAYEFRNGADADWTTARAIAQLDAAAGPLFLYAHYMDPHAPYAPPEAYREVFGPLPELSETDRQALGHTIEYLLDEVDFFLGLSAQRAFAPLSEAGREAFRMMYDAECRFMDAELAKLFAYIDAEMPNTLVIVTADHGEEFWEHGGMGHGLTMYEEQLAVPLLLRGPGLAPANVERGANTVSLAPTVAGYLDGPVRAIWQGVNLLHPDPAAPEPELLSTTYGPFKRMGLHTDMIRVGWAKYIEDHKRDRIELYNLLNDPAEHDNIAGNQRMMRKSFESALERRRELNRAHTKDVFRRSRTELPESLVEQLEAQGYLDAENEDKAQGEAGNATLDADAVERLNSLGYSE